MALLVVVGCGSDATAPEPVCGEGPRIRPGQMVVGELTGDDPVLHDARVDYHSLLLEEAASLQIRLTSDRFDPLLYLFRDGLSVAVQGYDPAGQPPGRPETATILRALGPGCHLLGASAWDVDGRGAYTLRVERFPRR